MPIFGILIRLGFALEIGVIVIRYIAYTWQGEKVEGILDVDGEEEAPELLHQEDLIPYRLTHVRPRPSLVRLAPFLFKPKPQELIEFTRGVSSLLRSGIPLRQTLAILRTETRSTDGRGRRVRS